MRPKVVLLHRCVVLYLPVGADRGSSARAAIVATADAVVVVIVVERQVQRWPRLFPLHPPLITTDLTRPTTDFQIAFHHCTIEGR